MTAYYFAARYSRHSEMREYRDQLIAAIPGARVRRVGDRGDYIGECCGEPGP